MNRFLIALVYLYLALQGCRLLETHEFKDVDKGENKTNPQTSINGEAQEAATPAGIAAKSGENAAGAQESGDSSKSVLNKLEQKERELLSRMTYARLTELKSKEKIEGDPDLVAGILQNLTDFHSVIPTNTKAVSPFNICLDGLVDQLEYKKQRGRNEILLEGRVIFDHCLVYLFNQLQVQDPLFQGSEYVSGIGTLWTQKRFNVSSDLIPLTNMTLKEASRFHLTTFPGQWNKVLVMSYVLNVDKAGQKIRSEFQRTYVESKPDGSPCENIEIDTDDLPESLKGEKGNRYVKSECSKIDVLNLAINSDLAPVITLKVDHSELIKRQVLQSMEDEYLYPVSGSTKFQRNNITGSLIFRGEKDDPQMVFASAELEETKGAYVFQNAYFVIDEVFEQAYLDLIVSKVRFKREAGLYHHVFYLHFDLSDLSDEEARDLKIFSKLTGEKAFVLEKQLQTKILLSKDTEVSFLVAKGRTLSTARSIGYQIERYPPHEITFSETTPGDNAEKTKEIKYAQGHCQTKTNGIQVLVLDGKIMPDDLVFQAEWQLKDIVDGKSYDDIVTTLQVKTAENRFKEAYLGTCRILIDHWDVEKSASIACSSFSSDSENSTILFPKGISNLDFLFTCDIQYD